MSLSGCEFTENQTFTEEWTLVLSVTVDLRVPHGHCSLLIPMATGPWSLAPLSSLPILRQGVGVRKTFKGALPTVLGLWKTKICDRPTMMTPPLLSFCGGAQNSVDTSPCGCLSLLSPASYIMLKCEKHILKFLRKILQKFSDNLCQIYSSILHFSNIDIIEYGIYH